MSKKHRRDEIARGITAARTGLTTSALPEARMIWELEKAG